MVSSSNEWEDNSWIEVSPDEVWRVGSAPDRKSNLHACYRNQLIIFGDGDMKKEKKEQIKANLLLIDHYLLQNVKL